MSESPKQEDLFPDLLRPEKKLEAPEVPPETADASDSLPFPKEKNDEVPAETIEVPVPKP